MSKTKSKTKFDDDSEYVKYKGKRPNKKMVEKARSDNNPNIGPRTEPARKVAILMNRMKHRPKSIIIQTDDEIVVQVRGDFDHLVKSLRKTFNVKGKDTSSGHFRQHDWKIKGYGLLNAYFREGNTFCSVRFKDIPGFGVKFLEEEPEPPSSSDNTVGETATEEDLEAISLD